MSFTESNNLEDFVGKIDWEGGVTGALDYGLTTQHYILPEDVAEKWDDLTDAYGEVENLTGEFWALVKQYGVDY